MRKSTFNYDAKSLGEAVLNSYDKSYDELDQAFKDIGVDSDDEISWLVHLFTLASTRGDSAPLKHDLESIKETIEHITSNVHFQTKYNLLCDQAALEKLVSTNRVFHKNNKLLNEIHFLLMAQLNRDLAGYSLLEHRYDEFIELFKLYGFAYGSYLTEKKHLKINHLKAKLIGSMAHAETNKIKKEIEREYWSRRSQFKRYGYSAAFKREMAGKYPELRDIKSIERWITELNRQNPERPSSALKGESVK